MNKIFFLIFLANYISFAQQIISFEEDEGFVLGSLDNQNEWEVTEASDGILSYQVVTDEIASDGEFSFKNAFEPDYGQQWFPIFGVAKPFNSSLNYNGLTVSYDVLVTEQFGADFEFSAYSIVDDTYMPVFGLGIENQGRIYVISSTEYDITYIDDLEWQANEWYSIKIEVSHSSINYYLNGELVFTDVNFSQLDVYGINMLHDNYGGHAYYDNISFDAENLSTESSRISELSIYPNPVRDVVNVKLDSNLSINKMTVTSLTGEILIEQNSDSQFIDLSSLNYGLYILSVKTINAIHHKTIVKL